MNKALSYAILLFGFFPILPTKLKGFPVAVLILASLVYWARGLGKPKIDTAFYVLISLLLINVLSVVYSGSFIFPWKKFETSISFLLVPLAFLIFKAKEPLSSKALKGRRKFFMCFIYCTGVLTIISLLGYFTDGLFEEMKVNSFRKAIVELPFIGDHPIYISIYLAICILFVYVCFRASTRKEKIVLLIIGALNVFHLLLLSSKGVIIALLVSTLYYIFSIQEKRFLKLTTSLGLLALFMIALMKFPNLERRFREIGRKTTYTELRLQNSSSIRLAIYKCGFRMAFEKPLLGYGWGMGNKALTTCYKEKSKYLSEKSFNSHNQYLGFFLDGGLPAVAALLFFLAYFFNHALLRKDLIFASIIILYAVIMITENILVRQSGIIPLIFLVGFLNYSRT